MISNKIQSICQEFRTLQMDNQKKRFKQGFRNSKSTKVLQDRRDEMGELEKICDREGVSLKAIKNILGV